MLPVATLDSSGKIPVSQLPDSVTGALNYQGVWNATTNTPTIPAAASGNKGFYRKVSVAGTTTINSISVWNVGDLIVSNGTTWDKIDGTDTSGKLNAASNLSDLTSNATARTNLNLGTAATHPSTDFDSAGAATTALATAALKANNLSDLPNAITARTNLGLGSSATHASTDFDSAGAASTVQELAALRANNLSDLSDAATARTNLGLGSSATHPSTDFLLPANIRILHADGSATPIIPGANTDAARGIAILLASSTAISGDAILVGPGTYTISSGSPNIAKNGVNWWFTPGSILKYTGTSLIGFFDDSSAGANSATSYRVGGNGVFIFDIPQGSNSGNKGIISITNASSVVTIECDEIQQLRQANGYIGCIHHSAGKFTLKVNRLLQTSSYYNLWWEDGEGHYEIGVFDSGVAIGTGGGLAIDARPPTSATPTGYLWIKSQLIVGQVIIEGSNPETRVWVIANEITDGIAVENCKAYVDAQKIGASSGSAVVQSGGNLWLRASKVSSSANEWIQIFSGTGYYEILHFEDAGITNNNLQANSGVYVGGGTLNLTAGGFDPISNGGDADIAAIATDAGIPSILNILSGKIVSGVAANDIIAGDNVFVEYDVSFNLSKCNGLGNIHPLGQLFGSGGVVVADTLNGDPSNNFGAINLSADANSSGQIGLWFSPDGAYFNVGVDPDGNLLWQGNMVALVNDIHAPLWDGAGRPQQVRLMSSLLGRVVSTLFEDFTDHQSSSTTETDLLAKTFSQLSSVTVFQVSGDWLKAEYGVSVLSTGGLTKRVRVYFAGNVIFDSGALTVTTSGEMQLSVTVIRTGTTTARALVSVIFGGVTSSTLSPVTKTNLTGLNFTANIIIKTTGQSGTGAATGDVTNNYGIATFNAASGL